MVWVRYWIYMYMSAIQLVPEGEELVYIQYRTKELLLNRFAFMLYGLLL